jgi:hypothetical protein
VYRNNHLFAWLLCGARSQGGAGTTCAHGWSLCSTSSKLTCVPFDIEGSV